ncbi:acyl-CoA-binding domain-containing protein 4 [Hyperolius riggenbachi]|uniref:acyl-CoA-binding domain-containing protein 4 n=1 Tax=Hyperolius riggenbachi TaxID=752182 RepID=UPI0035A2ECAC
MGTDQDETGYQRQFNAAVSVIQNLPKSGSYRPSYEEMLRFYSHYKQATVGPCNIPRPGFWDPIGRYKWDAWSKLGHMSQEDAMCTYIRDMKMVAQKIIDTVPLHDKSPEMFEPFRPLYEVIPDMPRPPDSFFKMNAENEASEGVDTPSLKERNEELQKQSLEESWLPTSTVERSDLDEEEQRRDPIGEATLLSGDRRLKSWGSENEEFSDGVEILGPDQNGEEESSKIYPHLFQASDDSPTKIKSKSRRHSAERRKDSGFVTVPQSTSDAYVKNPSASSSSDTSSGSQSKYRSSSQNLSSQIATTVEALQTSIRGLCQRLESLEQALQDQQQYIIERTRKSPKEPKRRHPAVGRSQTLLFILVWPFIVHWLVRRYLGWKR